MSCLQQTYLNSAPNSTCANVFVNILLICLLFAFFRSGFVLKTTVSSS